MRSPGALFQIILFLLIPLFIALWVEGKEPKVIHEVRKQVISHQEIEQVEVYTFQTLLDCIQTVEVGGSGINKGIYVFGDDDNALGPFQIHWAYHEDAMSMNDKLDDYMRCLRSYAYSVNTVKAYMKRYLPEQMQVHMRNNELTLDDCEYIARTHSGGPKGHFKECTITYWNKVKELL